jgi:hypothetical protein
MFAGRRLGVFFAGLGNTAAAVVGDAVALAPGIAGAVEVDAGLETATRAGFGDCFEQALTASISPRSAKPAIMASFCWRDQDESAVPEIMSFVGCSVDFRSPDL